MGAGRSAGRAPFARYWTAASISSFGTAVTAVAMPLLVTRTLGASSFELGVVNAAQFVPYVVLGLLAGVWTDRWRRRPVLVWSSLGRALSLGAVPVLWATGTLTVWPLVGLLLAFGSFSVFGFAATQALLPRLVPREQLVVANARLDQTDAAAQTLGPALGGGLVALVGAPVAIAIDAVSYVVDAVLNAGLRVEEPTTDRSARRSLRHEIGEGLHWTYRHATLGPLAVSTHMWFVANAASFTALSWLAIRQLHLSGLVFGLLVAAAGAAGLVGASLAPAIGRRIGSGPAIIATRTVYPVAWLLAALAPGAPLLFVALALHGLAGGVSNAHELGLRQGLTPDALLGRVNATGRSANRAAAAVGALLGGTAIGVAGSRVTLAGAVVLFAVALLIDTLSPLRRAR